MPEKFQRTRKPKEESHRIAAEAIRSLARGLGRLATFKELLGAASETYGRPLSRGWLRQIVGNNGSNDDLGQFAANNGVKEAVIVDDIVYARNPETGAVEQFTLVPVEPDPTVSIQSNQES